MKEFCVPQFIHCTVNSEDKSKDSFISFVNRECATKLNSIPPQRNFSDLVL